MTFFESRKSVYEGLLKAKKSVSTANGCDTLKYK